MTKQNRERERVKPTPPLVVGNDERRSFVLATIDVCDDEDGERVVRCVYFSL